MQSTMHNVPLSMTRILNYGGTVHGATKVTTWCHDSARTTTFAAVKARAGALAWALQQRCKINVGDTVATLMFNTAEHFEAMLAVPCMGAVFTPLNHQLLADQVIHSINHAQAEVVLVDKQLVPHLARIVGQCPKVRSVIISGVAVSAEDRALFPRDIDVAAYEQILDGRPTEYPWPVLPEDSPAALCYSTGTTGQPKGVVYSHRSLYLQSMTLVATDSLAVESGETFLCGVPIFHVLSWGVPYAAFMVGAPLIFMGRDTSPEALSAAITTLHPRMAHGVPTLWMQLLVHYLHTPPARMSLQEIFVGGSPAPPALIHMWEERYGVDVIQVWGMTETQTVGTVARPPAGVSGEARQAYRESQGRFPAHLEYRVVADGRIVGSTDRNAGEIQVRGNLVTNGYYDSPAGHDDGLASTFRGKRVDDAAVTAKYMTDDGWIRTGDMGSVTNDGFLTVHDRSRDAIRSGGEWIYSAQLENLIMNSDRVIECAVIGYPSKKWGQRPLAVTVLHEGIPHTAETARKLRDEMRAVFPAWMLPEYWTFVDSIDKTSVGKFDKKDLRTYLAEGQFSIIELDGPGTSTDED